MKPFEMPSVDEFVKRISPESSRDLLEWVTIKEPGHLYAIIRSNEIPAESLLSADPGITITDDRPLNEYFLLRRLFSRDDASGK
jgi:hypothetical protein